MPTLDYEDSVLRLCAGPREREKVKLVPGARYDHRTETWRLHASWSTMLALRAVFLDELELSEAVAQLGWEERRRTETVASAKLIDQPILQPWAEHLYPHQASGARFLATAQKAILADDLGVGKTIQAIAALLGVDHAHRTAGVVPSPWPVLVVATNSMLYKWAQEIEKWAPGVEVHVAAGSAVARRKAMALVLDGPPEWPVVLVMGWGSVWRHSRLKPYPSLTEAPELHQPKELDALGFRTIVVDEAHKMLGHKAKQTRALWSLLDHATYGWALTGTVITGKPEALWSIMHGLAPHEYPSRTKFIERYILSWKNWFGGLETAGFQPEHRDEFFSFFDARFFRRTKAEVLPELPEMVYSERVVDMSSQQSKAYREMRKDLMTRLADGTLVSAPNPLDQVGKLLQYASFVPGGTSCKVDAFLDILDEAGGKPLVVFVYHRELANQVSKALDTRSVKHARITGEEQPYERFQAEQDFQNGQLQVIVCSLGAGSESITLTAADTVVFLQRSWKMGENLQAEGRIHRMGQTHESVYVIDVVTKGTVEDDVHVASAAKASQLQAVCRDPEWLRKVLA